MKPLRLVLLTLVVTRIAAPLLAEGCAATPEAAAQSAFAPSHATSSNAGYRVQDVQVDSVMRRVFVRVGRCDNPAAPLVLVPLQAPLQAAVSQAPQLVPKTSSAAAPLPSAPPARTIAARAGDTVLVTFASSAVQIELEGTLRQAAALGDTVEVTLKRRPNAEPDEPEHRMRGILRAPNMVEVQP